MDTCFSITFNRFCIGIVKDEKYYYSSIKRIEEANNISFKE